MCIFVCVFAHPCGCPQRGQNKVLDAQELELQGFVGYPMGCWEANLALQEQ